jgi:DUF1680 family protein
MIPTWTYVKGRDGLYVNLFIGSTINVEKVAGTDVEMVQQTDYPWSGRVAITVNPETPTRFTVQVRVPNRTTSELYTPTPAVSGLESLAINGNDVGVNVKVVNGYVPITKTWRAGDKIELVLPMKVQRIKASDKIAATTGKVALRYGPLLYSAEAADQSLDKVLAPESALTTEWKGDLLGGVMVIKGTWADGSALTAVPNYARDNRLAKNDASSAAPSSRRGPRAVSSLVWLKDQ